MKSFEKFQYDTSPYVNEEIEELDEISLVGMVRAGGKAIQNVVKAGKDLINRTPTSTPTPPTAPVQKNPIEQKRNKLNKVINNQSKKVERVQQRSDKKITNAANNLSKSISRRKEVLNRAKNMPLTVKRVQDNQNKNKGLSNLVSQTQKKRDDVVKRDAKIDQNIRDLKSDDDKQDSALGSIGLKPKIVH